MEEGLLLAPEAGIVSMETRGEGPARHEQLGPGGVVAVRVHGVGEVGDV